MKQGLNRKVETNTSTPKSASKSFFSWKRILFLTISFGAMIGILIYTLVGVLGVGFGESFGSISLSSSLLRFYFSFLFFAFVVRFMLTTGSVYIRTKQLGIKLPWYDWAKMLLFTCALGSVTPTTSGGEPAILYYLHKNGLSVSEGSGFILSVGFIGITSSFLIVLPCYIYMSTYFSDLLMSGSVDYSTAVITIVISTLGTFICGVAVIVSIALGFSKKVHYYLSRGFNSTKKLFKMKYHTKEQTYQTYVVNQTLRRDFLKIVKNWQCTLAIFFLNIFITFVISISLPFSIFLCTTNVDQMDFGYTLVTSLTCNISNSFIPTPGGDGTLQQCIRTFFVYKSGESEAIDKALGSGITVWRSFTFYFPMFASLFFSVVFASVMGIKKYTKKGKTAKKKKQ